MSEVERYVAPQMPAPAWVATMAPAAELARQIADTDFVPKSIRGSVAKVTACIMFGAELGLGPMQSLAKIDVIEGVPAPRAELARALLLEAGHELVIEESSTTRCVIAGRRKGSDNWQRATWTMDDAKRAGLDGKQNWRKYPRAMLIARASAELVKSVFADVMGGISQFAEELDDEASPDAPVKIVATVDVRKRALKPAVVVSDVLPPLPDEIVDAEIVDVEPEGLLPAEVTDGLFAITDAQLKKLAVMLGVVGVKDRADRLALVASIIGRPVATSRDLTITEASKVIEALTDVEQGRAGLAIDGDGTPVTRKVAS